MRHLREILRDGATGVGRLLNGAILNPVYPEPIPRVRIPISVLDQAISFQFQQQQQLTIAQRQTGFGNLSRYVNDAPVFGRDNKAAMNNAADAIAEIGLALSQDPADGFISVHQNFYRALIASSFTCHAAAASYHEQAKRSPQAMTAEPPSYKARALDLFGASIPEIQTATENLINAARSGRSDFRKFLPI